MQKWFIFVVVNALNFKPLCIILYINHYEYRTDKTRPY